MSEIWLNRINIQNYRSFGAVQEFHFPDRDYGKPVSIIGYNNAGKTTLINAIRYAVGESYLNANTLGRKDLHHLNLENNVHINSRLSGSNYEAIGKYGPFEKSIAGEYNITTVVEDNEIKSKCDPSFFGAPKHYNIFYINFHKIKDEISTKKTSWGNLTSFLAKHIQKIVETDPEILKKESKFKTDTRKATGEILQNTKLKEFIQSIKHNYSKNLRNNNCEVEFVFPDYDEVFLKMVFKIGLDGNTDNLLPIDHFGDGYISMFVMAVIQAIAETETQDKCLFLFEEPESFLHENHQEYFYKMVLCNLARNGHQVIYTTHSYKMVDMFDTQSIIRLEYDEESRSTIKKYNKVFPFTSQIEGDEYLEPLTIDNYNSFIKSVEPNLNKLLFSKKVVLVEGPNDHMSYRFAIEKYIKSNTGEGDFSDAYLNFLNISVIVHHGKLTAVLLTNLCKHFGLDYYVINDWDLDNNFVEELSQFHTVGELKASDIYRLYDGKESSKIERGTITSNWRLLNSAIENQIHFNVPKLERVLNYDSDDKSSFRIFKKLESMEEFPEVFFPESLKNFLEFPEFPEGLPHIAIADSSERVASVDSILEQLDEDLPF